MVVKHMPGGKLCDWLFGGDPTGKELAVFGPLGAATFRPEEGRDVLCVAGGSGIAGMMSIVERAVREGYFRERRGRVFFGVRTLADAFYIEEMAAYAAAVGGRLEITLALSHETVATEVHPRFPAIRLAGGMVGDVMIRAMAGRYDNTVAFVAGPPVMVDSVLHYLTREAKMPRAFVRYDKFA
jgi:toluene monooxygenase electron transfer component